MNAIMENLKKDGLLLKQISKSEQTPDMCALAISQNPKALQYASKKCVDVKVCFDAVKENGMVFRYVPNRLITKEMCFLAVQFEGDLLKYVPTDWRNKEICLLAVTKKPEAFVYIPEEIRYEIFNEEAPLKLLKSIVKVGVEYLIYMPISKKGTDVCLANIKRNLSNSQYLPVGIKESKRILDYQKSRGKISILRKWYNAETSCFRVEIKVTYDRILSLFDEIGPINKFYTVNTGFQNFDEFYSFVDSNLYDAELRTCEFEGVDLRQYNIEGAVIHQDVLADQGLFDGSYFEGLKKRLEGLDLSEVENNEICLPSEFNYPKPVDEDGYESFDYSHIPFFYVSDIHLCHKVFHEYDLRATKEEVRSYVKFLVHEMLTSVGTIPDYSYLLIAGDTSSEFEILKIFYEELVLYWDPQRIIVIHGNHELWDPWDEMENNIQFYREYFKGLGITYLQNDLLLVKDRQQQIFLTENKMLEISEEEIRELAQNCSIAVLGGIGFSGLNDKYNAVNMRYGKSFEKSRSAEAALKRDRFEAHRFDEIYRKLTKALPKNKVIILTHMKKYDWNACAYIPNWIYVNGHNHRNYVDVSSNKEVYADNQIGYNTRSIGLKYFYIDNEYDIFAYLDDGIHEITNGQYVEFNRGKLVQMSFKRDNGQIYMIKKNGKFIFFIYCLYSKISKHKFLYLLAGGRLSKLQQNSLEDLTYFYNKLNTYTQNVHQLLERYTGGQKKISDFVKRLGGSGKIHGCIVDIDKPGEMESYSYCHFFVNPVDNKVTPYYAYNITSRTVYRDFKTLLESNSSCKLLQENYTRNEKEFNIVMPVLDYSSQFEEWGDEKSMYDEGSYLYKISRIIKGLQYVVEKDIVRLWKEELLHSDFIIRIKEANRIQDMIEDKLMIDVDVQ